MVDLPGIVYKGEHGSKKDIFEDIRRLYTKYIKDPNSVILVALPANAEAATQQAYAFAEDVDPAQVRTIGIVTKIDLAELDAADTLPMRLRGIGNNSYAFKLGVVAVRNRTLGELKEGISNAEVDRKEAEYFAGHPTLSKMDDRERREMLGYNAMVTKLVMVQYERIKANMPMLVRTVVERLEAQRAQLARMPPACDTEEACRRQFMAAGSAMLRFLGQQWNMDNSGIDSFKSVQAVRAAYQKTIEAAKAAEAAARHAAKQAALAQEHAMQHIEAAQSEVTQVAGTPPADPSPVASSTPASVFAGPAIPVLSASNLEGDKVPDPHTARNLRLLPRMQDIFDQFDSSVRSGGRHVFSAAYGKSVQHAMLEARGKGLPDSHPPSVMVKLVTEEAHRMAKPAHEMVEAALAYTSSFVKLVVQEFFGDRAALASAVEFSLEEFLTGSAARCQEFVEEQLLAELDPFTVNHYYSMTLGKLRSIIDKVKAKLAQDEEPELDEQDGAQPVTDTATGELTPEAADKLISDVERGDEDGFRGYVRRVARLANADNPVHAVLENQCRMYCYRKVMHKRFVDVVAQRVRMYFPWHLAEGAFGYLQERFLGMTEGGSGVLDDHSDDELDGPIAGSTAQPAAPSRLSSLMQENPIHRKVRSELMASITRLEKALRLLAKHGHVDGSMVRHLTTTADRAVASARPGRTAVGRW